MNGDPVANLLLAFDGNPFYNGTTNSKINIKQAPKFVRAVLYEYQYPSLTAAGREKDEAEGWEVGVWWKRKYVGEYMPPIEKNNPSVKDFLRAHAMKSF